MASSCELLDAELALDRVEAVLAIELPPHLRAFAAAYAAGRAQPAAPAVLRRASTIETARRALPHPLLAERALALLRLSVPVALHVTAGTDYAAMCAARDALAQRLFGVGALDLIHRLHGAVTVAVAVPTTPDGWRHSDGRVPSIPAGWRDSDGRVLEPPRVWRDLAARHGVDPAGATFLASDRRARTFVVGPGEVVVVIPARIDAPAARFALLHELGHALAAALSPPGIPRALDEAIAAATALPDEPIAIAARARRLSLARHLAAVERGLVAAPPEVPWALWHDPGAQAAYVEAERLADPLVAAGELRAAIAASREAIDRTASSSI